ncbi:MAG: hypothetical protein AB7I33_14945, partial [Gemmatimonadales bacterium]
AAIRTRLREVVDAEGIKADDDALTLIARQADGGMRDALSVLDQCLSFGEAQLTAPGVREILGLVADEIYGEVLDLICDRRPELVFPLVDRLLESGADLAEFMNGAAESLRSLLMVQVGAAPEGLTEGLRQQIEAHAGRLQAGDVLRMLKLLADYEAGIRRSANPRLMVETLLLRWAMMDRTVDLAEVLGGNPAAPPSGPAAGRGGTAGAAGAAETAETAERARPTEAPESRPIPFALSALEASWSEIADALRAMSPFLGEAVASARPVAVTPPDVTLRLGEDNPVVADRLARQRQAVEEAVSRRVGGPVRIQFATDEPVAPEPRGKPRRMSDAAARAERLKVMRGRDPALDAAAEDLDLEIVD